MVEPIYIANFEIQTGRPSFIIAEAGVNHNGDLNCAYRLIDAAIESGANAVKFQTFNADSLVTRSAPKAEYQKETTDGDESQFDMIKRLELSREMHHQLKDYCDERGILFISSPFDESSSDLLEMLGVSAYKIPSGEITNLPYLAHIARKGKPMIVSTGMATLGEVETAVQKIRSSGNDEIVLLQCVSNYPADPVDVNLSAMGTMATAFGLPVGYSDHTLGQDVAIAAAALGACVIEKHLTLDKKSTGPDHQASLEPDEFTSMVHGIRIVELALGHGRKEPTASEANTASVARKSLVAAMDILVGETLTKEHIAIKRPGTGLPPSMRSHLVGRTTQETIVEGSLFTLDMLK